MGTHARDETGTAGIVEEAEGRGTWVVLLRVEVDGVSGDPVAAGLDLLHDLEDGLAEFGIVG